MHGQICRNVLQHLWRLRNDRFVLCPIEMRSAFRAVHPGNCGKSINVHLIIQIRLEWNFHLTKKKLTRTTNGPWIIVVAHGQQRCRTEMDDAPDSIHRRDTVVAATECAEMNRIIVWVIIAIRNTVGVRRRQRRYAKKGELSAVRRINFALLSLPSRTNIREIVVRCGAIRNAADDSPRCAAVRIR